MEKFPELLDESVEEGVLTTAKSRAIEQDVEVVEEK